jgi:DUF971 family protein
MADRRFEPTELRVLQDGLFIDWADGHKTSISPTLLRGSCGCAQCVDEITHQRQFGVGDVLDPINIEDFLEIGHYAIEVLFSDLHYTGIYPFKQLRRLCECPECVEKL